MLSNVSSYTSEEFFPILESLRDGILITDHKGYILWSNSACCKYSGFRKEDVVGKHAIEVVFKKEKFFSRCVVGRVLNTKQSSSLITKNKMGERAVVVGTPVFDNLGNLWRIVVMFYDVAWLRQNIEQDQELGQLNLTEADDGPEFSKIVFQSDKMNRVVQVIINKIAPAHTTVLVLGETGVGKEVVARLIHEKRFDKNAPLLKINCGAIPKDLLEAELFGYEPHSFTGASPKGKKGLFEEASNGTLFLDEIGELPLNLQVKLLHALQDSKIKKVGGTKDIQVNPRIIAATNKDLSRMIEEGTFRKDLFYRLNVINISVPPLRDRKDDILPLANLFLEKYNQKYRLNKKFTEEVYTYLNGYHWPGNVRELENFVERLAIMSSRENIAIQDILDIMEVSDYYSNGQIHDDPDRNEIYNAFFKNNKLTAEKENQNLSHILAELEKKTIEERLIKHRTSRKAAKSLGITHSTIIRKAQKYGIEW